MRYFNRFCNQGMRLTFLPLATALRGVALALLFITVCFTVGFASYGEQPNLELFKQEGGFVGVESWIKAKNIKEFKKALTQTESDRELKTLCLTEIRKQKVPHSCYEWVGTRPFKRKKDIFKYLDEKCLQFSPRLKNLQEMKHILQVKSLTPFCRKTLVRYKKIREYQLRDKSPSHVFVELMSDP